MNDFFILIIIAEPLNYIYKILFIDIFNYYINKIVNIYYMLKYLNYLFQFILYALTILNYF